MSIFSYFHPLSILCRKRVDYLNKHSLPPFLQDLVTSDVPNLNADANELTYAVLDIETTGLDPDKDDILSIGWVFIKNGQIDLAKSQHIFINHSDKIKAESAVINHITPQMLVHGLPLADAMRFCFKQISGCVLVAHGTMIESRFINAYVKKHWHVPTLPLLWLDTLCLEKHFATAIDHYSEVDLTLYGTRDRYGLPEYTGHNAIVDAMAAAELLLAQQKRLFRSSLPHFGRLFRLSQRK